MLIIRGVLELTGCAIKCTASSKTCVYKRCRFLWLDGYVTSRRFNKEAFNVDTFFVIKGEQLPEAFFEAINLAALPIVNAIGVERSRKQFLVDEAMNRHLVGNRKHQKVFRV